MSLGRNTPRVRPLGPPCGAIWSASHGVEHRVTSTESNHPQLPSGATQRSGCLWHTKHAPWAAPPGAQRAALAAAHLHRVDGGLASDPNRELRRQLRLCAVAVFVGGGDGGLPSACTKSNASQCVCNNSSLCRRAASTCTHTQPAQLAQAVLHTHPCPRQRQVFSHQRAPATRVTSLVKGAAALPWPPRPDSSWVLTRVLPSGVYTRRV